MVVTLTRIFLLFFACLYGFSASVWAQKEVNTATHVWIEGGNSTIYIPVRSKKGCKTLTYQAAILNTSKGHCYNRDQFLQEIKCRKLPKKGEGAKCTVNKMPTN